MSESPERPTTYRDAGVDRDAAASAIDLMKRHIRSTFRPEVLADVGTFGGLFALGRYEQPVLVASVDGVGTKLKIAFAANRHDTVGADLVNHCVNDILTTGAEPLFFLDYFATGKLVPEQAAEVVKGLARGCREVGCALLGGETAEMPSLYAPGEYDLAGCIVGVVERARVVDGRNIQAGDIALGLPSGGLHTNGYALVRRIFGLTPDLQPEDTREVLARVYPELGRPLVDVLLDPHRCYLDALRPQLRAGRIKALAHITGGGLLDNVPRVLPSGVAVRFRADAWPHPPIFGLVQRLGGVPPREMYRAFNMGVGMLAVVAPQDAPSVLAEVPGSVRIGEVVASQEPPVVIEEGGAEIV